MVGHFDGGDITSDAGGLLLREVERRTGIIQRFARCFQDREFRESRISTILEACRESPDDSGSLLHFPKQQSTRIRCDVSAIKMAHHFSIS